MKKDEKSIFAELNKLAKEYQQYFNKNMQDIANGVQSESHEIEISNFVCEAEIDSTYMEDLGGYDFNGLVMVNNWCQDDSNTAGDLALVRSQLNHPNRIVEGKRYRVIVKELIDH